MSVRRYTRTLSNTIKNSIPLGPVLTLIRAKRSREEGSTSCTSSSSRIRTIRSRNTTTRSRPLDEVVGGCRDEAPRPTGTLARMTGSSMLQGAWWSGLGLLRRGCMNSISTQGIGWPSRGLRWEISRKDRCGCLDSSSPLLTIVQDARECNSGAGYCGICTAIFRDRGRVL